MQQVEGHLTIFRPQKFQQGFYQLATVSGAGAQGVGVGHIQHEGVAAFCVFALAIEIGKEGRFTVGFRDDGRALALIADNF